MLKVFLAEDEIVMREGIKKMCIRDRFRMYDVGKDRRIKNAVTGQTAAAAAKEPDDALEKKSETNQKKENETMKKTMKINGMMCGHCEARVKKALEAVEGVQEAVVSHCLLYTSRCV